MADAHEGLDDEHARAAAGARAIEHRRRIDRFGDACAAGLIIGWIDGLFAEQRTRVSEVFLAVPIGEEAVVMANAVQSLGEHVNEETADELVGMGGHVLVTTGSVYAVVLVFERDTIGIS